MAIETPIIGRSQAAEELIAKLKADTNPPPFDLNLLEQLRKNPELTFRQCWTNAVNFKGNTQYPFKFDN